MKLLKEVAKQFGNSKPVFEALLSGDDTTVVFELKEPYRPSTVDLEDPIARLIGKRYSETLKLSERRFIQNTSLETAHRDIIDQLRQFVEQHSPLKNPTQSKLYKWLRDMDDKYHHPSSEGFIGLYRYIFLPRHDVHYVQNVLAILEMMREKYENAN